MLTASAPAKLNFGLHVLRRRTDGFHDLDTVFVRIPWCDTIRVEPAERLWMTCTDPSLPTDDRNLCMRAARLLMERFGTQRGAHIHLEKHLPHGAGLGGGSSDAATTLRLLDTLWGLHATAEDLHAVALDLGSDVPLFLDGPLTRGRGRGEILNPLQWPPGCRPAIAVAVPDATVSTPDAFRLVSPRSSGRPDLAALIQQCDVAEWPTRLENDFQEPVARMYPAVGKLLDHMAHGECAYSSLSGTGSAVFGVFDTLARAQEGAHKLRELGYTTWSGYPGDPTA
jgi:4-diphosphocytidyl-2-C-methyl-D-erythritol kinase